jgi:hypothetical protein
MANLVVGVPIWRCPSMFMNVAMWEHCTFDNEMFMAKFITLTPLSLLISCKILFSIVGLKMYFLMIFLGHKNKQKTNSVALSPRANYTD